MPGKQVGLAGECWPDRLIGDLPNVYLYASNNPSEGTLAKRRAAATLVSYLTPPIVHAGLYRGLLDLKASLDRYRGIPGESEPERHSLAELIQTQAAELDLVAAAPTWNGNGPAEVDRLRERVLELEYALIPHGMHVVGDPPSADERHAILSAMAEAEGRADLVPELGQLVRAQPTANYREDVLARLAEADRLLRADHEIPALLRALDGRHIAPAPGGDLLRTPSVLPTGRNLYGFDPYQIPSRYALEDGRRMVDALLARHQAQQGALPETVAMVLWGTDNMKSAGAPLAQVLVLLGARPRFDGLGRLAGAELVPLAELGRPRIDVIVTVSGVFRDLLPLQVQLLAEAAALAAAAEEPLELNHVRAHALAHRSALGCDAETAALRVFSNAEGAYGSNVNLLVESGRWNDDDELAETFARRKGFAYGARGAARPAGELLRRALAGAELAFQNLESVELGVTDVDQYYESLGGMSRLMRRERQAEVPVYIADATGAAARVRTLEEQVSLESRTRLLNPKWYEGMLQHGAEGVRQIEAHVSTSLGWSATTAAVPAWVYARVTDTFVLDDVMRARLADLNPHAAARLAGRLLDAGHRGYWSPDAATLEALQQGADELEDRLEGVIA
jgi:magnesium chelatase subunit H